MIVTVSETLLPSTLSTRALSQYGVAKSNGNTASRPKLGYARVLINEGQVYAATRRLEG